MLISLCLVLTESSITTNIVMQSRMTVGLSASGCEECTRHSHRLQGKLLLRTDSVVNIGHSVLAFLLTFTASVDILCVLFEKNGVWEYCLSVYSRIGFSR
jgi:hypothetical protein